MKTLLFLLLTSSAFASPYLTSDPPAYNDVAYYYKVTGYPEYENVRVPTFPNRSLMMDLTNAEINKEYNITVEMCMQDDICYGQPSNIYTIKRTIPISLPLKIERIEK